MISLISHVLCRLGYHGPTVLGIGPHSNCRRNYRVGYLHRRCGVCGSQWVGYETMSPHPRRCLAWTKLS